MPGRHFRFFPERETVIHRCILSLGLALPVSAFAAGWQVDLTSSRHADALPLHKLDIDDVAGQFQPRSGRNIAYMHDELRLSTQRGANTWSLLARQDATLVSTADALDIARTLEAVGTPTASQQWNVHAKYQSYTGGGAAWSRTFEIAQGWQALFGLQALVLGQYREFQLDGPAAYDAALNQWAFDLRYRRIDSRLEFPFQQDFAARGFALLTDGALRWRGEDWSAAVSWRNAGWMRWRGLPQQDAVLSTNTQAIDADGFVIYKPLIEGRYTQETVNRTIPGIANARVGWRLSPDTEFAVSADYVDGFGVLPRVAARQRVGEAHVGAAYDTHERRLGMALDWAGWRLGFGIDRLGDEAHSREFRVGYVWGDL